jgi:ATP-dependent Lon protease
MADFEQFSFSLEKFSGTVRLFPLPNLVMFPQVMQPLRVFEPRYRELLEDALADDGLIAMATLAPGWEADYEGRPPLARVACLGRVAAHHRFEGGQYNVLLAGLRRVRLLAELPPYKSYREARVEVFDDCYPLSAPAARPLLQRELREAFLRILPDAAQTEDSLEQLLSDDVSLGTLTDLVTYMMDITTRQKVALLAEANVHRRAEALLKHLAVAAVDLSPGSAGVTEFPPEFSAN